jgi:hypothetical protein
VQTVRQHRDFGLENDPYGEHDFGTFEQLLVQRHHAWQHGEK